jgi:hypothetical protein
MGQKRLRNLDRRLARQAEEEKRKFEQAIKFKVESIFNPMDRVHDFMYKSDTKQFWPNRKDILKDIKL